MIKIILLFLLFPLALKGEQLIDTATLKSWYDSAVEMIVVDARAEDFFDGHLLPNAKRLPHYSSDETIAEVLPERIGTFVVYCGGIECPASKILSTRLVELGYVTVFDYAEGIPAWMAAGYPTHRL